MKRFILTFVSIIALLPALCTAQSLTVQVGPGGGSLSVNAPPTYAMCTSCGYYDIYGRWHPTPHPRYEHCHHCHQVKAKKHHHDNGNHYGHYKNNGKNHNHGNKKGNTGYNHPGNRR